MISFVILFVISLFIIVNKSKYQYKCFLLTMKDEKLRQKKFFENHDSSIPIEVIYGSDTRNVETAREYEDKIPPKYFNKAVEMHYNSNVIRPDITYFNMGAIGCFMGHMEFYDRCFDQGLKYAVIFEDNVIVKSNQLYKQIQDVIDKRVMTLKCASSTVYPDFHSTTGGRNRTCKMDIKHQMLSRPRAEYEKLREALLTHG